MKKLLIVAVVLLAASQTNAQTSQPDLGLPDLHKIKTITLSPAYSCRSKEDFQKGYEQTALFLSDYAKRMNAPDLLFNGACGAEDYLRSSYMSLIADLGADLSLEELNASQAFNVQRVHSMPLYSRFTQIVKIELNHTYAVVINDSYKRGLLFFTVVGHVPNQKLDLRYAAKEYQILNVKAQAPGFNWDQKNQQK